MGVSGFLISWAICLAISRQALSRSDRASISTLFASSFTIRLYSSTRPAISSCPWYMICSFFFPSLISLNFCWISLKRPGDLVGNNDSHGNGKQYQQDINIHNGHHQRGNIIPQYILFGKIGQVQIGQKFVLQHSQKVHRPKDN